MKVLVLGVLFGLFGVCAEQPLRQLTTHATPFANSALPLFRHGYLVLFPPGGVSGTPATAMFYGFTVYGPDGQFSYQKILELPGGREPIVRDVDFDQDGSAAVGATALGGPSGFQSGILLVDRDGRDIRFIDTGRYSPDHVAIAPDRSIWTLGWQGDASNARIADRQDYLIVRHFSADGKELKGYLPRSSFPGGLEPGTWGPGVGVAVTKDRVGILVYSGKSGLNAEWVELDWDGNVLDRSRTDNVHGVALAVFTADNHVYLAGLNGEVYKLDSASHTWKAIPKLGAGFLMGADGDNLVFGEIQAKAVPIQLQWFPQP
jgi:hypothetical protein